MLKATNTPARVLSGLFLLGIAPYPIIGQSSAGDKLADILPAQAGQTHSPGAPRKSPAQPPRVNCQDGQLSIVADNSLMSSIFNAIRACTGVDIKTPPGFVDDRTFLTLGPGPEREILNAFLSSTDFNFVIESSTSPSRKIQSVTLTERVLETPLEKDRSLAANLTLTPARRAWLASRSAGRPSNYAQSSDDPAVVETTQANSASTLDLTVPATVVSPAFAPAPAASSESKPDHEETSVGPGNVAKDSVPATTGAATSNTDPASPEPAKDQPRGSNTATPLQSASQTSWDSVPLSAPSNSSDSGSAASQPSVLQKQINQMQQLFEQRKQMNSKPPPDSSNSTQN